MNNNTHREYLAPWSYEPAAPRPPVFTGSLVSSEDEQPVRSDAWARDSDDTARLSESSDDEVGSPEISQPSLGFFPNLIPLERGSRARLR